MDISLFNSDRVCRGEIQISGSKSEYNRLLILKAFIKDLKIENISNSDDSVLLDKALKSNESIINIGHAGTAMRFLTAYYSTQVGKEIILTGSKRMQERPVGILVDALKKIGADINYTGKIGFPPLKIRGKNLISNNLSLPANVSSQFITAILLISPFLKNGIKLKLVDKITSLPYLKMTISLLKKIGVKVKFDKNTIDIKELKTNKKIKNIIVESDWSSASYLYSCVALSIDAELKIKSFSNKSLQGDSIVSKIYEKLGVRTIYDSKHIVLIKKKNFNLPNSLECNLIDSPDIAQTIAVTCFGLGVKCDLYGLHTLKIKETDRLNALKLELQKLGSNVSITDDSIHINKGKIDFSNIKIKTYNDHRMAMAFAPLGLLKPITIESSNVVSKSFPDFWDNIIKMGFQINKV